MQVRVIWLIPFNINICISEMGQTFFARLKANSIYPMKMYYNKSMNESCMPSYGKNILDHLIKIVLEFL